MDIQGFNHDILNKEEEQELFKKYNETHDINVRNEIIKHNLKLVYGEAIKYKEIYNSDDYFQEGIIGLIEAVERFDYKKGFRFSTYAILWIDNSIKIAHDNQAKMIRLPRNKVTELKFLNSKIDEFVKSNGYYPTYSEMAKITNFKLKKIYELLKYNIHIISLEKNIDEINLNTDSLFTYESDLSDIQIASDSNIEEEYASKELKEILNNILNDKLTKKEINIIKKYYGIECDRSHTLFEIADEENISHEAVRIIRNKALKKIAIPKIKKKLEPYLK